MQKLIKLTIMALLLFFCLTFKSHAQYGNVWTFGYHYGIDFNSGTPVFFDTKAIFCRGGAADVCDSMGQLLFKTDGTHVWYKLHQHMPNLDSLTYVSLDLLGSNILIKRISTSDQRPVENSNSNLKTKIRLS